MAQRKPPKDKAEAAPPAEQTNGVLVKTERGPDGQINFEVITLGDCTAIDAPTLLELGAQRSRANLGL